MNASLFALAVVLTIPVGLAARGHAAPEAPERLGQVHFETSCSAAVRDTFDRAVALLHSFEFRRAKEGFEAVLRQDAGCAIAYWGIALCHWGNPFAGIKAGPPIDAGRVATAAGLATGSPTPRERGYIAAAAELFKEATTVPHRDRTLAYARAMESVQRDAPDDIEARIFYALAVNQTALPTDKTYKAQLQAAAILEPLWREHPHHPGPPHYIIHAYDHAPLAPRALPAARRYAEIAPAAPHALHMPSHTFTRVGAWKESAATNAASEKASVAENAVGEALHAMDYEEYAFLQMARDNSARDVLGRMPAIFAKLDLNALAGAAPGSAGVYARAAIPARYALERGAWQEASRLEPVQSTIPFADAISHFARAIGAARSGQPAAAQNDIAQLAVLRDRLAAMKDEYWREQVDIARSVALAWIAFAEGRRTEAIDALRAAADREDATDKSAISPGPLAPAREQLGEMLLEAGNAREALTAFESTMTKEPSRFRGIAGAARAAELLGDAPKARTLYRRLLDLADSPEIVRPEIERARTFLERS